jgi:N-acetylglucosaminyldiphosphoundecaprenol N-acetyl-beta-D-mannosaminyltransferase
VRYNEKMDGRKANILGVEVASNGMQEALNIIGKKIAKKSHDKPLFVATVNPEFVMLAQGDEEFKRVLNSADLAVADGRGLLLADIKLKEVVPGRKLVSSLLDRYYRTFFLGGKNGVAKEMAKRYGGEWDEGHDDIKSQIANCKLHINQRILNKINRCKPDILLVAYGAPWQEKWIAANLDKIKAKVVMGVGGTFDYLIGRAKLPPEWMEQMGLEWLWRLIQEPWRWRRQLNLLGFVVALLRQRLRRVKGVK